SPRSSTSFRATRRLARELSKGLIGDLSINPLHVEPHVLEVEVALDSVHDLVADPAAVAELDDRAPLGLEQLAAEPLVALGLLLEGAVVGVVEAGREPRAAEGVEAPKPLGRVGPYPVLVDQLVQTGKGCLRRVDSGLRVLLGLEAVVAETQRPDHG